MSETAIMPTPGEPGPLVEAMRRRGAIEAPDPWKVAHDALSTYVTALMENRAAVVVERAFDAYIEAKAAAMGDDDGSPKDADHG